MGDFLDSKSLTFALVIGAYRMFKPAIQRTNFYSEQYNDSYCESGMR